MKRNFKEVKSLGEALKPMFGYNAVNILFGGAGYIVGLYYLTYLTEVEKLSASQAGLVNFIPVIWDAILTPVMGLATDRTRSRFGRHRRYFLWGVLPFALGYFMLWNSFGISGLGDQQLTMLYYIGAMMLYRTAVTLIAVPHTAMLPTVAPGYFERTQYNSISYIINSVGMILSFSLVSFSLGFFRMETPDETMRGKFMMLGGILCVFFTLPILGSFFGTKEPSSLKDTVPPLNAGYSLSEFTQVFRNRAFRQYFFLSLLQMMGLGFYSNTDQYFVLYVAKQMDKFNLITTVSGVAEASGFPLNYLLVRKYGKQFCGKLLAPVMLLGVALNLFITEQTSPKAVTILLFLSAICYNFGYSGPGFVVTNIQPDISDVDELITGRRREGVIATFSSFIKKVIAGLMSAMVGFALDAFGFQTGQGSKAASQTGRALFGLRLMFIFLPLLFLTLSYFGIFRYKMTKADHEMMKAAIRRKHETGDAGLTQEEIQTLETIAGHPFGEMWIGKLAGETEPTI